MTPLYDTLAPLKGCSFGTLSTITPDQLDALLGLASEVKSNPDTYRTCLKDKSFALVFEKHSTRTRVSFEVGVQELGGSPVFLSRNEIQLGRGEPIEDTAKVLSRYVQGIILRTWGQERFDAMSQAATIPVINALTDQYHPCQVLADLQTIREHRGALAGKTLTWIGDGNNMAHSLMLGCALSGMHFRAASPDGYSCDPNVVATANNIAESTAATLTLTTDPQGAVDGCDVVVTDVFASMGQEDEQAKRLAAFEGYQVNEALMGLAQPDALFLHCLPAHRGEEVTADVIDGRWSAVWDEAENRLHAQKALMLALMGVL